MNQWIFLIDGYGIKKESNQRQSLNRSIADGQNLDAFKSFIVQLIDDEYSFYNDYDSRDSPQISKDASAVVSNKEQPAKESESELKEQALQLQLGVSNTKGNEEKNQ